MVNDTETTRPTRARWICLAAAALVLLGGWARCANFRSVFPPSGEVELVPADSHYYVRFALLQLRSFPGFTRFDPFVNFPTGARILWPPLHALAVAAAVAMGGAAQPERSAAFVDPALACVELAIIAWMALRWLHGARALGVVLLLSLTPAAVDSGLLGNADHHVHEPFIIAAASLALGHALASGSRRAALLAGLVLGLGRLLTPLGFAYVPLLALAVPLAALLRREDAARAGDLGLCAGLACAAVLAVGVLAFGEPRGFEYELLSWFHPLLALAAFAGGAGLAWALGGARGWRFALPLALASGLPLLPQVVRALGHLGRADPLLAVVLESRPLFPDLRWALALLGAPLLALPFALWGVLRRMFHERAREVAPALLATGLLLLAAAAQARFSQALAGAMAVLLPLGLPDVLPGQAGRLSRRLGLALLSVGALSLAPPPWPLPLEPPVKDVARVRPTLRWMREHLPPASLEPLSGERPRYGVAASYLLGHFINLWAERPAIASTFSQAEAHVAGNLRAGALLAAVDDEGAFHLAERTGARYVLVTPSEIILGYRDFDRPRSLLTHLLDGAGMATGDKPATGHFRLVFDSEEERLRAEGGPYARLFEAVPGAVLTGEAAPGQEVMASLDLATRRGAKLHYERRARTGPDGRFTLRVAYATEPTPEVRPAREQAGYLVRMGERIATVQVTDEQVTRGQPVDVR